MHGAEHAEVSADAAENADLVLLVVDGPLRDSEFQLLRRLGDMEKRVLLCLNKEDWYEPEEKQRLLGQLREQVRGLVGAERRGAGAVAADAAAARAVVARRSARWRSWWTCRPTSRRWPSA